MKKIVVMVIAALLTGVLLWGAESDKMRELSLEEFLKGAAGNGRFSEILIEELALEYDEELKGQAGPLLLSLLTEYSLGYDQVLLHGLKGSLSLSKLFALSGTTLKGSYSFMPGQVKAGREEVVFNTNVNSSISLRVEQEIAKNGLGRSERLKRELAGSEKELAYLQVVEAYEDYLAALITLYIEWYSLYENIRFTKIGLAESERLLANTKQMLAYSVASRADVDKSELEVLTKKGQLKGLESEYRGYLYRIKEIMGIYDTELHLLPAFTPGEEGLRSIDFAGSELEETRSAELNSLLVRQKELSLEGRLEELLPSVTLFSGYTFSGSGFAFENERSHTFNFGVELSYAIPQPGTFAAYNKGQVELEKQQVKSSNGLEGLKESLELLRYSLELEREMAELAARKVELAKSIVQSEERDYRQGNSSLNNLISRYNSLNGARLEQINHTIRYYRYYVEYLRLSDRLVDNEMTAAVKG